MALSVGVWGRPLYSDCEYSHCTQTVSIGYASLAENMRFPETGVLPLSLTTQHEEVMGRICFVYGCNHRSDGEKGSFFRFPTHCIQRGRWERLCR